MKGEPRMEEKPNDQRELEKKALTSFPVWTISRGNEKSKSAGISERSREDRSN